MDTDAIDRLFEACDLDGSGFIDEDELANICSDLSREEVGVVFSELDRDGDGKISVSEFAAGFKEIRDSLLKPAKDSNSPIEKDAKVPRRSRDRRSNWNHEETKQRSTFEAKVKEVVGGLDESFGALSWRVDMAEELLQQCEMTTGN
ncbi:hypothetical protein CAPTEDRAFT_208368 [Capitella teleta]|uniref:EF-hand domain-containing protein n=1 Tax=Capitella teleta TaxID=283909 RepID=R7TMC3_CAPTE|nr:hypothetical protein CAPTEDRAFT_208368 [Capitella teleta]|eukprot:ELT94784.1 hypothetical protein CAPTEDRAFT_208368 [Capitella teleta]